MISSGLSIITMKYITLIYSVLKFCVFKYPIQQPKVNKLIIVDKYLTIADNLSLRLPNFNTFY